MTKPWTPDSLAAHWECSAETVRAMIRDGKLPAFRVGGNGWRIRAETVEAYECGTIGSELSKDDSSSCGTTTTASAAVIALRHTRPKRQSVKPAT
ncbi:helix-turn-helix domain-containing protein [Paracoccus sulfuroxidans]|uniref:helix-turn-helix domain-containing protein n=1 Tax=Paracoccus sulfuroxidans TaxID=384678 RepID=UPI0011A957B4